jgi:hypothetical protein
VLPDPEVLEKKRNTSAIAEITQKLMTTPVGAGK